MKPGFFVFNWLSYLKHTKIPTSKKIYKLQKFLHICIPYYNQKMTNIQYIAGLVSAPVKGIEAVLQLLSEDCTIPFISRYRKDMTGNLDEVTIENIAKYSQAYEAIVKRKDAIIKSIQEQNALSPELGAKINQSFDLTELEDLYLPYKKKKKTRADAAREKGLEPLAKIIMSQNADDMDFLAAKYLNDKVANEDLSLIHI